jgi:hypothetical protein
VIRNSIALAVAAALAGGFAGSAGEAQDRIFRVGLLGELAPGDTLVFDVEGTAADGTPETGSIEVAVVTGEDGKRVARIDRRLDGRPPAGTGLSATGGHPVLLMFLETTLRAMAEATGGNPFYIRNLMREALAADVPLEPVEVMVDGVPAAAVAATFHPFAADPNRSGMGAFGDLALTLTMSDAVPGEFARFEARAAAPAGEPGYAETVTFSRVEGEEP